MISGARYSGVPQSVHVRPFTRLAKPKSVICEKKRIGCAYSNQLEPRLVNCLQDRRDSHPMLILLDRNPWKISNEIYAKFTVFCGCRKMNTLLIIIFMCATHQSNEVFQDFDCVTEENQPSKCGQMLRLVDSLHGHSINTMSVSSNFYYQFRFLTEVYRSTSSAENVHCSWNS